MNAPKPRPPLTPGASQAFPVLPLRDIVVFPHMIVPLFVGREKSIKALIEQKKVFALFLSRGERLARLLRVLRQLVEVRSHLPARAGGGSRRRADDFAHE